MTRGNAFRHRRSGARGILRRLRSDGAVFSLLETVIAVTVIFGSLLTRCLMPRRSGFQYESRWPVRSKRRPGSPIRSWSRHGTRVGSDQQWSGT